MSYNTAEILEMKGMTEEQFLDLPTNKKKEVFYDALKQQLPLGMSWLEETIAAFKAGDRDEGMQRLSQSADPNTTLGKQIIRLFFPIPRQVISEKFGVAIGSYNCCRAIIAENEKDLHITLEEQFMLQSTPDC